jgi:hypothetical protein
MPITTLYSVFRFGEIKKKGNHKGLPLQEMYLTQKGNAIDFPPKRYRSSQKSLF